MIILTISLAIIAAGLGRLAEKKRKQDVFVKHEYL